MIAKSKHILDSIWLREIDDKNVRHVTLRRNFTEEINVVDGKEDISFTYEEVDVFVCERDNMIQYLQNNFGNLFELGLTQMEEKNVVEKNLEITKNLLDKGEIVNELQMMGKQITEIMLEVI